MKNLLKILLYGSLLLVGCYILAGYIGAGKMKLPPMVQHYVMRLHQRALCQTPIGWRIGELDQSFDLTRKEAEAAGRRAAALWNDAAGETMFVFDKANGFPINFSYDERQQEILREALLERDIADYDQLIGGRLAMLKLQEEELQRQIGRFAEEKEKLAADIASLQQQLADGAPLNRRDLENRRRQLLSQQNDLQAEADRLNEQQRQLQWQQKDINATIRARNDLVPDSQRQPGTREVGLMKIHKSRRTMTIFAFQSQRDLVLTMAHEFGHALGLDHTDTADSLMYAAITKSQKGITDADIAIFNQQCAE